MGIVFGNTIERDNRGVEGIVVGAGGKMEEEEEERKGLRDFDFRILTERSNVHVGMTKTMRTNLPLSPSLDKRLTSEKRASLIDSFLLISIIDTRRKNVFIHIPKLHS
jgi:hypothetical protein